ncbi:hypothetical protein ES703_23156 [subsurface metagenome]
MILSVTLSISMEDSFVDTLRHSYSTGSKSWTTLRYDAILKVG